VRKCTAWLAAILTAVGSATPYDASYLELALRFATLDGKLAQAAAKEGVLVLN